jgi:hypothetical protein
MNFIEPEETEFLSVDAFFDICPIQPKNKEWLRSLILLESKIQLDLKNVLEELIKKNNRTIKDLFRVLFLFDYNGILTKFSSCFDENKLSRERINILPELFTKKQDDKPAVFQDYIVDILDNIHNIEKKDSAFSIAYNKKKLDVLEASSLAERVCYYIRLQNFPKRTYETGEKTATSDVLSFLSHNTEEKYSIRLITELEEIPETNVNILTLPFLLCGKELFTCICNALSLYFLQKDQTANFDSLIKEINIPQWDEKNFVHEIFFELAEVSKNMSIVDRIFENIDADRILSAFSDYILNQNHSFVGILLKGEYSHIIKPIRNEIEYFDWVFTATINKENPYQIYFKRCRFFLEYLKYLAQKIPENRMVLFQELSFLKQGVQENNTIRGILDSIAQEKKIFDSDGISMSYPNQQKEANDLYEEFIDVITEGAAKYPVMTFLPFSQIEAIDNRYKYSKHEFESFKQYCRKIKVKKTGDAMLIGQIWFIKFHGDPMTYLYHYDLSKFADREKFIYENIFSIFINDEEFVYNFLSIPQGFHLKNKNAAEYWALYYLTCWIVNHNYEKPYTLDIFKAASRLLIQKKIIFPEKIAKFIVSNEDFNKLAIKDTCERSEAILLLCQVFAAINENDKYQNILKTVHKPDELLRLYLTRYRYTHEGDHQEFLDYLLNMEFKDNEKEKYLFEIIQAACEENLLSKQIFLKKLPDYIINCKQRRELLISNKLKSHLSYLMKLNEDEQQKNSIRAFINTFYERTIQEIEPSCIELCTFLKFRSYSYNIANIALFTDTVEHPDAVKIRCGKMLRNFRNIEQEDIDEEERNLRYDCAWLAGKFIFEKTGKAWKTIKPLIVAFRRSKKPLVANSLHPSSRLPEMIMYFFNEDQKTLKELIIDMANDFMDYFTPKDRENEKTKLQIEQYTEFECKEEGFDLNLREPSPFWRYAYIRALTDLGVKKDLKGHYFHKQLEKISQTDPSEQVREAAKKTMKELDTMHLGIVRGNYKKRLYEAYWWIRYAQMLSLGKEVDNKKANDLRVKEWR